MKMVTSALVASLALTGCASLAPEYSRPAAPVPETWPDGPADR